METKWIAILCIGLAVAMFSPIIFMERGKSECRIEAIKAGMSADDIVKLCK